MEIEEDIKLLFLDILLTRMADVASSHQVYRKKTHTNKYIQEDSHHHPAHKIGFLYTLVIRAKWISNIAHFDQEIDNLVETLKNNGYKEKHIRRLIKKTQTKKNIKENKWGLL